MEYSPFLIVMLAFATIGVLIIAYEGIKFVFVAISRKMRQSAKSKAFEEEIMECLANPNYSNRYRASRRIVEIKRKHGVGLSDVEQLGEGPLSFASALADDIGYTANFDGEPPFSPDEVMTACDRIGATEFGRIFSELMTSERNSFALLRKLEEEGAGDERYNHPDLVNRDAFQERLDQIGGFDKFMAIAGRFFEMEYPRKGLR